jgi:ADYC domain
MGPVKESVMQTGCVALFAVVMAGACAMDRDDTSSVEQESGSHCPAFACSNSDELIHYNIHELNLKGLANTKGASLATSLGHAQIYTAAGVGYDLQVKSGKITGTRHGLVMIAGQQLVGTKMVVTTPTEMFDIHITAVREAVYPIGSASPLELYVMEWTMHGGTFGKNVCNGAGETLDRFDWMSMHPDETLVFEGTRFDPDTMTDRQTFDADWFNFGCAGHTLAKMRLTRNTAPDNLDWRSRQATLKLLVADYCGTGTPFTVAGVPLRWKGGLMYYFTPPTAVEARWTEAGATCLGTPRLLQLDPPSEYFPDLLGSILAECPSIRFCSGPELDVDYTGTELRVSALPL